MLARHWISSAPAFTHPAIMERIRVKVYRIVHDVIRHWCSDIRDQVMVICCGLYNLRLRQLMAADNICEP